MVRDPHPFHSFSKIPQTLLNVTFNDISMLQEKASNIGLPPKKLLPISSPKNCEYHRTPARAQNKRLFINVFPLTDKYSLPVLFFYILLNTINRIGKEASQGNQKDNRKPGIQRSNTTRQCRIFNRCSGIQPKSKACTHHTRQQSDQQPLCQCEVLYCRLFSSSLIFLERKLPA